MSSQFLGVPRTQALQRAVALLRAVADAPGASASALARGTELPRPTVTRTLRTLADAGLVEQRDRGWALGYELVRLARAADPFTATIAAARGPLERLRDASGESALLAVRLGPTEMEILLQLDAPHIVGVTDWVGAHPPLHASAAGKLLLAELAEPELAGWLDQHPLAEGTGSAIHDRDALRAELRRVRRRGWAAIVDELEVGLTSLAAPVRAEDRSLAAMVGVSGPSFRLGTSRRREIVQDVLAAAADVAARLPRPAG